MRQIGYLALFCCAAQMAAHNFDLQILQSALQEIKMRSPQEPKKPSEAPSSDVTVSEGIYTPPATVDLMRATLEERTKKTKGQTMPIGQGPTSPGAKPVDSPAETVPQNPKKPAPTKPEATLQEKKRRDDAIAGADALAMRLREQLSKGKALTTPERTEAIKLQNIAKNELKNDETLSTDHKKKFSALIEEFKKILNTPIKELKS